MEAHCRSVSIHFSDGHPEQLQQAWVNFQKSNHTAHNESSTFKSQTIRPTTSPEHFQCLFLSAAWPWPHSHLKLFSRSPLLHKTPLTMGLSTQNQINNRTLLVISKAPSYRSEQVEWSLPGSAKHAPILTCELLREHVCRTAGHHKLQRRPSKQNFDLPTVFQTHRLCQWPENYVQRHIHVTGLAPFCPKQVLGISNIPKSPQLTSILFSPGAFLRKHVVAQRVAADSSDGPLLHEIVILGLGQEASLQEKQREAFKT